jgi:hypothetical protein
MQQLLRNAGCQPNAVNFPKKAKPIWAKLLKKLHSVLLIRRFISQSVQSYGVSL